MKKLIHKIKSNKRVKPSPNKNTFKAITNICIKIEILILLI